MRHDRRGVLHGRLAPLVGIYHSRDDEGATMTDEPWWRPLADALIRKVVQAIDESETPTQAKQRAARTIDAQFEDVPAKAPRKRRKALPAPPDPNVTGKAPSDEK